MLLWREPLGPRALHFLDFPGPPNNKITKLRKYNITKLQNYNITESQIPWSPRNRKDVSGEILGGPTGRVMQDGALFTSSRFPAAPPREPDPQNYKLQNYANYKLQARGPPPIWQTSRITKSSNFDVGGLRIS